MEFVRLAAVFTIVTAAPSDASAKRLRIHVRTLDQTASRYSVVWNGDRRPDQDSYTFHAMAHIKGSRGAMSRID